MSLDDRVASNPKSNVNQDDHVVPNRGRAEVTSWASSAAVRAVMVGNRKRDTRPEIRLRRLAHRMGLRYRVAIRPIANLPRTADLVFRSARVAVFVDGCFWHGCPIHFKPPRTNVEYWGAKIARNRERDAAVDAALAAAGWRVVRVWEHDDPLMAATRLAEMVGLGSRPNSSPAPPATR